MRKPLNLNSINQGQKEEASTEPEQLPWGRSINPVPAPVKEVLRQTDSSQSVLDAPAPGIPEESAAVSYSDLCRISIELYYFYVLIFKYLNND